MRGFVVSNYKRVDKSDEVDVVSVPLRGFVVSNKIYNKLYSKMQIGVSVPLRGFVVSNPVLYNPLPEQAAGAVCG